ncbi:MAG TPA: MopE-related protein, partial [Chitinophagaceae bacterium]
GDCNDGDAVIHESKLYYVDADKDGYGSTTTAMLCSSTAPAGYSTNNTDCNDNDPTVYAPQQYYIDADKDGYGSTATAMLCSATAPAGYSTNNTDCNDGDASINAPKQYYIDADKDGYGSTATAMVCASAPPLGYSTNNSDCDDTKATVYPGAVEVCGNGIDDNCNGQVDEGCASISVTIVPSFTVEGNSGKRPMIFIVALNKPATGNCSVKYNTYDGSAKEGSDYQKVEGIVSFTKGQWLKYITVYVYGDKQKESNEQFGAQLQTPVNVKIYGTGKATGTILNDDGGNSMAITAQTEASADSRSPEINTDNQSLKVFPNPVSNVLNVTLHGYTADVIIQLFTQDGKMVKQQKLQAISAKFTQQQLNVADLTAGIYFLIVTDEKGKRQTEKIIVSK